MSRAFSVEFADAAFEAEIQQRLTVIESALRDVVKSDNPLLHMTSRHLVEAGGKRFRPLLVLLAAQFGDPDAPGVVPAAVVMELTHLATLYHDDVMDEAMLRRGAPSANSLWDNTIAILTGDFLFARASDVLADLGPEYVRIQARTFERLVTGQIRETVGPSAGEDPLSHYLSVVTDKTGSLIATAARFGAALASAPDQIVDCLAEFGERIGVAFQLADDVLDVAGQPTESGKTPGTDLREGIMTLPVLHALASADPADQRLRALLSSPLTDDALRAEALDLLRAHPAMDRARADARQSAADARALLNRLPDITAKAALSSLCDAVTSRTN